MQFKRQKHEHFRKKIFRLDLIFNMELVLCTTPISKPVPHFLFADDREHPFPTDTFVFYLYLLTVNLIIHTSDCSIEADDCRTSFFNVTTRPYSLLSNYLIFPIGKPRVSPLLSINMMKVRNQPKLRRVLIFRATEIVE